MRQITLVLVLCIAVSSIGSNIRITNIQHTLDTIENKQKLGLYMRDYQIQCTTDSLFIMDGSKLVGVLPYTNSLGALIEKDNQ